MNHDYASKKLNALLNDIDLYSADEFKNQMLRIISGATGLGIESQLESIKRERVIAKEINDALIEQKQKLQAELNEYRNAILGMSVMLKNREWANLLSTNDAIAELDVQITNLHNELSQEKRDSLDCDDIKDLKLALSWMGYSTPESIEESVARQKHLIRDLIRSVLRQKESMTVGGE